MIPLLLAAAYAGAPTAPQLNVSHADIAAGNTFTYTVSDADPGTPVWLIATGTTGGRGACPPRLGGLCFTYGPGMTILARGTTDGHGAWSGSVTLPNHITSGGRALQAAASFGGSLTLSAARVLSFYPYCDVDGWEDDDTQETAMALDPYGIVRNELVCSGDEDWVAVDVPAGSRAVAWWTHDPNEGQVEATYLATAGLGTYFSSTTSAYGFVKQRWTNNEGADATVWFKTRVIADQGGAGVPYALRWNVEATDPDDCDEDLFEDNDSLANAALITAGTYTDLTACGDFSGVDDDFYAVELLAGDVLDVGVQFSHPDADIDIDLRDATGGVLASSGGATDSESMSWIALSDGTYYVHVGIYQDGIAGPTAEGAPYDMTVGVIRP